MTRPRGRNAVGKKVRFVTAGGKVRRAPIAARDSGDRRRSELRVARGVTWIDTGPGFSTPISDPRMSRYLLWTAILILAAGGAEAQQGLAPAEPGSVVAVEGGEYRALSVGDLRALMGRERFALINVHVPFEGEIPSTTDDFPYDEIAANLDRLPSDRSARIVLYCLSDRMSAIAAAELVKLGFTNVAHLVGGYQEWIAWGMPFAH